MADTARLEATNGGARQRGTNQSGMRAYNERLVLTLVREQGALAKTDIARLTGLSAQTVSVIMRALEQDGLLIRGEPIRGKIGQPLVPMSLNPDGAFFIGLKIGRRSAQMVLLDFMGRQRGDLSRTYAYPTPGATVAFVEEGIQAFNDLLTFAERQRIAGLGIAMPFELWNWADASGAPRAEMDQWRSVDIRAEIADRCAFPVYLQNDATAACGAELVFGAAGSLRDFLYFYVGAFIGGGIVLNRTLYTGASGNAGALGSMPVPGPQGTQRQLIDVASIASLETALLARGQDSGRLWTQPDTWWEIGNDLDVWIGEAGAAIAHAIVAASAVIDFSAAIVDGWMPVGVRSKLVTSIQKHMTKLDSEGLVLPEIREGTVGLHARAIGGASLPLSERFLIGARAEGAAG